MVLARAPQGPRVYVLGIAQGRFTIDTKGNLRAAAPNTPVGVRLDGKRVDVLLAELTGS